MTHQPISISLFENAKGETLSKRLTLNDKGEIVKYHAANLIRGHVKQVTCASLQEVYDLMLSLKPHQAVSFGVCLHDEALVLSQSTAKEYTGAEPVVTRTRKNFSWPVGRGIILFDYDPPSGTEPMTPEALVGALREAVPALCSVSLAVKPSVSSCIYAQDGQEIRGIRGQHVFAIVEDAKTIPIIGANISERLWLAGYGYIAIAGNGKMLERTIIDTSVWQPERLVFASAECKGAIKQQFPPINIFPGASDERLGEDGTIIPGSILPLDDDERKRVAEVKAEARTKILPAAQQKKQEWLEHRATEAAGHVGKANDQEAISLYKQQFENVIEEGDVLPPDLILYPQDGVPVTAAEVYANLDYWHGKRFADPMEPTYGGNDPRIAMAILTNTEEPLIYSHAHHGVCYYFRTQVQRQATASEDFSPRNSANMRFPVIDAEEFINGPEPEWIIEDILPKGELAMVFGPSGSGKTFFVLDLIAAIALGKEWNGYPVKQGQVVYVAAEGVGGFRKRIQAYEKYHDVRLRHILGVIDDAPNLRNHDNMDLAKSINIWGKAKVIVIDTLAQTTPGADENSSEGIGEALRKCKDLSKQTGAIVVLVHHCGKDQGRGARGWSGIKAALDTEIEITKNGDNHQARITKQKDGEGGKCFPFKLSTVELEGKKKTSCIAEFIEPLSVSKKPPTSRWQRKVYDAIQKMSEFTISPFSVADIIENAIKDEPYELKRDRRRDNAKRALRELGKAGHITINNNQISIPQIHNPASISNVWD